MGSWLKKGIHELGDFFKDPMQTVKRYGPAIAVGAATGGNPWLTGAARTFGGKLAGEDTGDALRRGMMWGGGAYGVGKGINYLGQGSEAAAPSVSMDAVNPAEYSLMGSTPEMSNAYAASQATSPSYSLLPESEAALKLSPEVAGITGGSPNAYINRGSVNMPATSGYSLMEPAGAAMINPANYSMGISPITTTPSGGGISSLLKGGKSWALPATLLGSNLLSSYNQAQMMEDLAKSQEESYEDYLTAINPPEEVKEERFRGLKEGILKEAPAARRRSESRLAGRGIRGRGVTSPAVQKEGDIQDAINAAHLAIYGTYNVPSTPGPVNYAPGTANLMGSNIADLSTLLAMYGLTR